MFVALKFSNGSNRKKRHTFDICLTFQFIKLNLVVSYEGKEAKHRGSNPVIRKQIWW